MPLLLLALATALPAAGQQLCLNCHPAHYAGQGSCSSCHRGNPDSDRKSLAHGGLVAGRYAGFSLEGSDVVRSGVRLLEQYACQRCHVVAGRGNQLAASLDLAASRKAPPELAKAISQPAAAMPDFRLDEQGETAIITALLLAGRSQRSPDTAKPQVVHFNSSAAAGEDLFSRKCGPCHQLLSQRYGALGRGVIGPNLSGLLSPFYPQNYRNARPWTAARLASWLQNPRRTRPWGLMQPAPLTRAELAELTSIMLISGGASP